MYTGPTWFGGTHVNFNQSKRVRWKIFVKMCVASIPLTSMTGLTPHQTNDVDFNPLTSELRFFLFMIFFISFLLRDKDTKFWKKVKSS